MTKIKSINLVLQDFMSHLLDKKAMSLNVGKNWNNIRLK